MHDSLSSSELTLAEQAALTGGGDFWHTAAIDRLGIPALRVTDGPSGARGHRWSVGTSASLPCGSALAATWNRELVRRVGRLLGDEARRKGAGVLLGPTVNIHRHPLNGRHFECFSEDPYLTAEMAVAYIEGVQQRGVGACVKHFVGNDQEHERHTIDVEIDERTLREIYLPPFEAAVSRARVWSLMGAYNRFRGVYCCENAALLRTLLKEEWAFDGVVVSDWFATHSTASIDAGLDLEMPGPARFLGPHVVAAVEQGAVSQVSLGEAAGRILRLIQRTRSGAEGEAPDEEPARVARAAAAEAIVLLRNEGELLPLQADRVRRIAVIGPLADRLSVQGGGSAEVSPTYVSSPRQAIGARAGAGVQLVHEPGCQMPGPTPPLDGRWLTTDDGGDGLRAEIFSSLDLTGPPVLVEPIARSIALWAGSPAPGVPAGHFSARLTSQFVADRSGVWEFGLFSAGQVRLYLDGQLLLENREPDRFFRRGANERLATVELEAGVRHRLVAEFHVDSGEELAGVRVGARPVLPSDARERAGRAAADADLAIVVVGYDAGWESEGADRPHLELPGDQTALVQAVAAANPRTVVVLNAGAPVTMPWADEVAAIVQLWFPGMEGGSALADVLFGDVDASGRLPTTFPKRLEDTPAYPSYPGADGVARYEEGVFVGYRHYDRNGVEPRFCFGHGLSYTRFDYGQPRVELDAAHVRVQVDVTNVGARVGREVVQLYSRAPAGGVERPDRELRDFAKLELRPGETQTVHFLLEPRAFATWDVDMHAWKVPPGEHQLLVGSSSRDIRQTAAIRLP